MASESNVERCPYRWLRLVGAPDGGGPRPIRRQDGQANIEYALLIAACAALVILGLLFLGGRVSNLFSKTATTPPGVLKPPTPQCDSSYPGACIPSPPPDLDCADLRARRIPLPVTVRGSDPHGLDPDGDGLGC